MRNYTKRYAAFSDVNGIRPLLREDLETYQYWKLPTHKYHEFNGPYFEKLSKEQIKSDIQKLQSQFELSEINPLSNKRIITNEKEELLGEVSWYWKSAETQWMEIGIVIFDEANWRRGIGKRAMELWITEIFSLHETLVRIGLSTWSGNLGMITLAEKLGMHKEAVYRKTGIVKGQFFDSVSYGILKEDWLERHS